MQAYLRRFDEGVDDHVSLLQSAVIFRVDAEQQMGDSQQRKQKSSCLHGFPER
ncbi:hypothetical protein AVEN_75940-1, partial [Araneus ventricosus]